MPTLKSTQTSILLGLLLIAILGSCTITKRHFGSGYHIEWKQHFSEKKESDDQRELTSQIEPNNSVNFLLIEHQIEPFIPKSDSIGDRTLKPSPKEETSTKNLTLRKSSSLSFKPIQILKKEITAKKQLVNEPKKQQKPPVDTLTWVALGFFITLIVAGFILLFSNLLFDFLYIAILAMFAIAGLIISGISLKNVTSYPDDYSGKGLTIAIFVLNAIICFGLIIWAFYLLIQALLNLW